MRGTHSIKMIFRHTVCLWVSLTYLIFVKNMFTTLRRRLSNYGEFPRRIKKRHQSFWKVPDAETVRNQRMSAADDMSKWKDVENWQRKLSNKSSAKEFAIKMGSKVAELYWRGTNFDTLDFNALPENYVIRPTIGHSSGSVFVMHCGTNLFDNKKYSHLDIRNALSDAVSKNPNVEFLVEEFLKDESGSYSIPTDYKFFCFNGNIAALGVINRLSPHSGFETHMDLDWNRIPKMTLAYPEPKNIPEKPACWEEMVAEVKKLSKAYEIFVRIDFYATDKGAVFGEFTPTPSVGRNFLPFGKKLLLRYWDTYCKNMI
jgi:hypothetical protein